MKIGNVEAREGEHVRGHVKLGEYPDGDISAPLAIVRGRSPGPVVWIQAALHGPEIGGVVALGRFLNGLDPRALRGTVVGLLVANPLGFRAQQRLTPLDGINANRVFPGNEAGTATEQLAARLFELARANADAVIDLHSGGDESITCFYAIWTDEPGPAGLTAGRLAAASGAPFLWATPSDRRNGTFHSELTHAGTPALIVESGGGGRVTETDLARYDRALHGICGELGLVGPNGERREASATFGRRGTHPKVRRGGFFRPGVAPGDIVRRGEPLGHMLSAFGDVVETLVNNAFDEAWVGAVRRPYAALHSGQQYIELVEKVDAPRHGP